MKHNKTSPQTIARKAAFLAETGLVDFSPDSLQSDLAPLGALCAELIGQDTPEQAQARLADVGTVQGYTENSPELYGTLRQTRQKYFGDVRACHASGASCDVELDPVDKALATTVLDRPACGGVAGWVGE